MCSADKLAEKLATYKKPSRNSLNRLFSEYPEAIFETEKQKRYSVHHVNGSGAQAMPKGFYTAVLTTLSHDTPGFNSVRSTPNYDVAKPLLNTGPGSCALFAMKIPSTYTKKKISVYSLVFEVINEGMFS